VITIGHIDRFPIPVHTFSVLPAHINSSINPILYYLFNSKIKRGIRVLLSRGAVTQELGKATFGTNLMVRNSSISFNKVTKRKEITNY
jgi:hypothetical protein